MLFLVNLSHLRPLHNTHEFSKVVDSLSGATGHREYWADLTGRNGINHFFSFLEFGYADRHFVANLFEDVLHLVQILLVDGLRGEIGFSEDNNDWFLHGQRDTEVLFCHFLDTHVRTDHDEAIVRELRGQTVHGGLEVLLVTTHI